MAEVTTQVKALLDAGWEVCTADEVRLEHEAETRRMQPSEGSAPSCPWTGRRRPSRSPAPSPRPAEQSRRTRPRGTGTPGRRSSHRTCSNEKPRQRRSRSSLTGLYEPGQLLERITPIHPPPYAPGHHPVEHVRNAAKSNIANIQRETPGETFSASAPYVTGRTFDYDFEHLPLRETRNDFVS